MATKGQVLIVGAGSISRYVVELLQAHTDLDPSVDTSVIMNGREYRLYHMQTLRALDAGVLIAPASRIKQGKGPRDKWGKLK